MMKNSSHIGGNIPHSGIHFGIMGRGEAGDNAISGEKRNLISPASPLPPNRPNPPSTQYNQPNSCIACLLGMREFMDYS